MKTTATLFGMLKAEMINIGLNEFFNNNQITAFEDEFQFIKKMMKYDEDTHNLVTKMFFQGYELPDKTVDKTFKKMFLNRFLNRQIQTQTVEVFSAKLLSKTMQHENYLIEVMMNVSKYILGENTNETTGTNTNTTDNRNLRNDLPQSLSNIDVNNDIIAYATENTINKNQSKGNNNSQSKNQTYNLDTLQKSRNLLEPIFLDIDRSCFLQVW